MTDEVQTIAKYLSSRNISRRDLFKFAGLITAALALPTAYIETIAHALAASPRLPVVWLEFQDCTGDTESFIRANRHTDPLQSSVTDPNIIELLLDRISLDYHETLMVPSGDLARKSLTDTFSQYKGQYLLIVEGSIPTALGGAYCTIGGRTALSIVQEACANARACIALGACAYDGGVAAASPNPTGAVGLGTAVPNAPNLINFPGCPANVVNLVASIVYFITSGNWPSLDSKKRPEFAYNKIIHDDCPREDHFESGRFVLAWGDAGHRAGWCLYKMGCKGPETRSNCDRVKWNDGTNWPIGAGHGCIGCAADRFWDNVPPVYSLSSVNPD